MASCRKVADIQEIFLANELICSDAFRKAKQEKKPCIFRNVDIGPCTVAWTNDYLASAVGSDTTVAVHVSGSQKLDFLAKNFTYQTMKFVQFLSKCSHSSREDSSITEGQNYYFRSLGSDPRRDVAQLDQIPGLAKDVTLPDVVPPESIFSTVYRISSPGVQLWTHYDVMDNFLLHISGKKRAVLFSPRDIDKLYMKGDKSEVIDIDDPDLERFPLFDSVTWHACDLNPGDVLYIPALWFHNIKACETSRGPVISVNMFWKDLPPSLYNQKDTYGNKDLVPVERAQQSMDTAWKTLETLPPHYQLFYARKLLGRMAGKIKAAENALEANAPS